MIHLTTLLPIVLMAFVTYMTRVLGYAVLRNRGLSPRALAVMHWQFCHELRNQLQHKFFCKSSEFVQ